MLRFVTFSEAADLIKGHYPLSVSIEQSGVALKKQGKEWVGLCPFHDEKSPSFSVNDEKGVYYCRGCRANGDVIKYHAKREGLSPGQIIKRMAECMDLTIREPERGRPGRPVQPAHRPGRVIIDQLVAFHDTIAQIAHQHLLATLQDIHHPLSLYLAERKIPIDIVRQYGLGYLPVEKSLRAIVSAETPWNPNPITPTDAQWHTLSTESGLLNGRYEQSMFQGRLLFPVTNSQGKCIAFSGRVIPGHEAAVALPDRKYVNSPETHIFQKSRAFFGLTPWHYVLPHHEASTQWRERLSYRVIVLVEGVTDVLRLALAGHRAVAGLGTALASEQMSLLLRHCQSVVVLLDGDHAGQTSAADILFRALRDLSVGQSIEARLLPAGEDPDTYFQAKQASRSIKALPRILPEEVWFDRTLGEPSLPLSLADRISIEAVLADETLMPHDFHWRMGLLQMILHRTGYAPLALGSSQTRHVNFDTESTLVLDDPTKLWLVRVARSPAILNALSPFAHAWWAREVERGWLTSEFEVSPVMRLLIRAFQVVRGTSLDAYQEWADFASLLLNRGLPSALVITWNALVTAPDASTSAMGFHEEVYAPDLWEHELADLVTALDRTLTHARDQALNRPSLSNGPFSTP